MRGTSLPARIAYVLVALPLGAAAGFYASMQLLPQFTASHPKLDPAMDGGGIFRLALFVGAAVALTASLFALTLPWIRHRKRRGRGWRVGIAGALVMLLSVGFADQGYGLVADLAFVAWLTYSMAFTVVRYGVVDGPRRASASAEDY
jgi:hypothetical protein